LQGLQLNTKIFADGLRLKLDVSLENFEVFEVSPSSPSSNIKRGSSFQRNNSTDRLGLASGGIENHLGYEYTRLISRRHYEDTGQKYQRNRSNLDKGLKAALGPKSPKSIMLDSKNRSKSNASLYSSSFFTSSTSNTTPEPELIVSPLLLIHLELTPNDRDQEGTCSFNLEELEILISPTAQWVGAIGTFFAWPADLEFW
jgi:hypothetical protein